MRFTGSSSASSPGRPQKRSSPSSFVVRVAAAAIIASTIISTTTNFSANAIEYDEFERMLQVKGLFSVVQEGRGNAGPGNTCTVSGGFFNTADQKFSTIGGGANNKVEGTQISDSSTIGGGTGNEIENRQNPTNTDSSFSTIVGGVTNQIRGSDYSSIGAGSGNKIQIQTDNSVIIGGDANVITKSESQTIGGGRNNRGVGKNCVTTGGRNNVCQESNCAVIGGEGLTCNGRNSVVMGTDVTANNPGTFTAGHFRNMTDGPPGSFTTAANTYTFIIEINRTASRTVVLDADTVDNLLHALNPDDAQIDPLPINQTNQTLGFGPQDLHAGGSFEELTEMNPGRERRNYLLRQRRERRRLGRRGELQEAEEENDENNDGNYIIVDNDDRHLIDDDSIDDVTVSTLRLKIQHQRDTLANQESNVEELNEQIEELLEQLDKQNKQQKAQQQKLAMDGRDEEEEDDDEERIDFNNRMAIYTSSSSSSSNGPDKRSLQMDMGRELNSATGVASFIAGGQNNTGAGGFSAVGGGQSNFVSDTALLGVINGGSSNLIDGENSTIVGGNRNWIQETKTSPDGTIGCAIAGGGRNTAAGVGSFIGGGQQNTATSGEYATVGGGRRNVVETLGKVGFIGGGENNLADKKFATILGGQGNKAGGMFATVLGGENNQASGDKSIAIGRQAKARTEKSIVINLTRFNQPASSTKAKEFVMRSSEIAMNFPPAEGENGLSKGLVIGRENVENLIDIVSGNRRNRRLREKSYEERRKHRQLFRQAEACTYNCLRRLDNQEDDEYLIEHLYREYEQNNLYIDEKRQRIADLEHELIDVTDLMEESTMKMTSSWSSASTPTPPSSHSVNVVNSKNTVVTSTKDNTRLRQSLGLRHRKLDAETVSISV